jgi:hypothetical protein
MNTARETFSGSLRMLSSNLFTSPDTVCIALLLWLCSPLLSRDLFFGFLILYTVVRTPQTRNQLVPGPLPTNRAIQAQNKHTQTSMPRVGFEPMTHMFEWAKTIYALDRVVTLIDTPSRTVALNYDFLCV